MTLQIVKGERNWTMLEDGTLIDGRYRVLHKIGEGGMSTVYMARNEESGEIRAVKEIRTGTASDGRAAKRGLKIETGILKKLKHPAIPAVIDIIDGDGLFLIVMDYIEGRTLDRVLSEEGLVDGERVAKWGMQLCDILGYLHSREPPVIYRDMKPSNIMLRPDGGVSLLDFDTAREYRNDGRGDTVYLGTRGYAAPEQYGGAGQTDERTDIYCLGATMYHLFTGRNPGMPPYRIYPIRHRNRRHGPGLGYIVGKCTAENPDDRYQSCAELKSALEHSCKYDAVYKKIRLHG